MHGETTNLQHKSCFETFPAGIATPPPGQADHAALHGRRHPDRNIAAAAAASTNCAHSWLNPPGGSVGDHPGRGKNRLPPEAPRRRNPADHFDLRSAP